MTWSSPSGRQDQGAKTEAKRRGVPATVPRTHGTQHDALLNAFPNPTGTVDVTGPRNAPVLGSWSGRETTDELTYIAAHKLDTVPTLRCVVECGRLETWIA